MASTVAALVVLNHLLHEQETTIERVAERYARDMFGWGNTLRTDLVIRLADARIESPGETRTFYLLYIRGLPMPEPQYEIYDANGVLVGRVDFAWPELGVFLEFDGKAKYQKYLKPGEDPADVVVREKQREDLIRRITGWTCIRLVWADLERPDRTAAMIRDVLVGGRRVAG